MDLSLIASVLSAAGVGSILGTSISQGKDRRETRARVLSALHTIEDVRWAPFDFAHLNASLRELESSALVARMPQALISQYVVLARAAAQASNDDLERSAGYEWAGGIEAKFADLVRAAARKVVAASWHPLLTKLVQRRWAKKTLAAVSDLRPEDQEVIKRSREYGL